MLETGSSIAETNLPAAASVAERKQELPDDYVLHISRMFDAPRDLVYRAFTDPAMMAEWMGPRGFQAMDIENCLRPGGAWRTRLHRVADETACESNGAPDLWMHGRYIE